MFWAQIIQVVQQVPTSMLQKTLVLQHCSVRNDKLTQRWWKFIQNLASKSRINYLAAKHKQQEPTVKILFLITESNIKISLKKF